MSHDSSRSCSKDHLFNSKCCPRVCAVLLKRQYSDGWRSIKVSYCFSCDLIFLTFLCFDDACFLRHSSVIFITHRVITLSLWRMESTIFPCSTCSFILLINFFRLDLLLIRNPASSQRCFCWFCWNMMHWDIDRRDLLLSFQMLSCNWI